MARTYCKRSRCGTIFLGFQKSVSLAARAGLSFPVCTVSKGVNRNDPYLLQAQHIQSDKAKTPPNVTSNEMLFHGYRYATNRDLSLACVCILSYRSL